MASYTSMSNIIDNRGNQIEQTEGANPGDLKEDGVDGKNDDTTKENGDQLKSNVMVKYLPLSTTQEALRYLFAPYGNILSCKLIKDRATGQSLGYGFVKYDTDDAAAKSVEALNGYAMENKVIRVLVARPPQEQFQAMSKSNVYIAGLPKSYTKTHLDEMYSSFGKIVESRILVDQQGQSRGIGFVRYENTVQAAKAIAATNGTTPHDAAEQLVVKYAREGGARHTQQAAYARQFLGPEVFTNGYGPMHPQPIHRRDLPFGYANGVPPTGPAPGMDEYYRPPYQFYPYAPPSPPQVYDPSMPFPQHGLMNGAASPTRGGERGVCLFVFHLPPDAKDEDVYQLFATFGRVLSVKIMTDQSSNLSKGYGFVNMTTHQDAQNAIYNLNGHRMGNKYLKVSFKKKRDGA